MSRRAKVAVGVGAGIGRARKPAGRAKWPTLLVAAVAAGSGCIQPHTREKPVAGPPRVVVLAPVLNLTGGQDFDPLKVTDLIASEFLSFKNVAVVPVNLTLAELQRRGLYGVEKPQDAVELARAFGAEGTVVIAIHEYNPYDPPVIGLTLQWYPAASGPPGHDSSDAGAPRWQIQRVFNAADEAVRDEIEAYAHDRDGDQSPYGWRKYTRSQELYVRYCGWATIRTMLRLDRNEPAATGQPHEAKS